MIEEELVRKIVEVFSYVEAKVKRVRRVEVKVSREKLPEVAKYLRSIGFKHLSAISCVDRPQHGIFELVYHLWSYENRVHLMLKTTIPRNKPKYVTMINVWPNAFVYERDIWEFFGIEFEGHPDLRHFILDYWDDIPPLRKDFNHLEYIKRKYGVYDPEKEYYLR
ncbi:MAG: NADH-quinone oxidoreductase subunit C [Thermoprotei archaeon]|nr:NADH-quinone oxidoreductase subunit C [Thermoprotei archaeon]